MQKVMAVNGYNDLPSEGTYISLTSINFYLQKLVLQANFKFYWNEILLQRDENELI